MADIPEHWKPQATSRMCFVCGRENPAGLHLHFYNDEESGQVIAPFTLAEPYQGYPGIAHGGVLAAILDEVAGRAINLGETEELFWVTAKLELRYRKPTPTGVPLRAVGWVVKKRDNSAEVAGEIRLPDGAVTASATALVVCPSASVLRSWETEREHWRAEA